MYRKLLSCLIKQGKIRKCAAYVNTQTPSHVNSDYFSLKIMLTLFVPVYSLGSIGNNPFSESTLSATFIASSVAGIPQ